MAITRVPFRRLGAEISKAARTGTWSQVGSLIDRNFDEITRRLNSEQTLTGQVRTVDASAATIFVVDIPTETTVLIQAKVVGRRTGGSSGTAEDGAGYVRFGTFKNVAGTATQIGLTGTPHTAEDQVGWDVNLVASGPGVNLQVTGAANNNVSWSAVVSVIQVSS